jgi:tRNA(Ile2) C34 agmatinyltransferase TiaS
LISNKARCRLCGDTIESKHQHDFVRCECGAIAIDGGLSWYAPRRLGNPENIENLCVYEGEEEA